MTATAGEVTRRLAGARLLGAPDTELAGASHDSRRIKPGMLFACLSGHHDDGRAYLDDALEAGASALLLEPPVHPHAPVQILVPEARQAFAGAARAIYGPGPGEPAVGITGTNGKTTVAYLIAAMLQAAGRSPLLVGSIESRWGDQSREAAHTTPEAGELHALWAEARDAGVDALVIETSSHGLLLHRVDGIDFTVGVFTNLSRDHLDYHPDLKAYRGAKTRLFARLPRQGRAVLNRDDDAWESFARATRARIITFGSTAEADVWMRAVDITAEGIEATLATPSGDVHLVSSLYGQYNVANLLAATAAGLALGLDHDAIAAGVKRMDHVPGRAERIDCGQPFVVLNDFAHTPDALAHVLDAARQLTAGQLHVVFGCGGDRDPGKRPVMGQVAYDRADRLTITSDNPRTEDPQSIIDQITEPLGRDAKISVQPDRTQAIRTALAQQEAGDTLIVAGKGHERYQIIGETRHRFDDAEVLRRELSRLGYGS
jgi:UDP-N-acetylmuramoyl-L-alanyl-D-glutamate--2,6-diaminopimelate ligase